MSDFDKSFPHASQKSAACWIVLSAVNPLNNNVEPECPGWPPVFFPVFSRRLLFVFRAGLYRSVEGGLELLELFLGNRAMRNASCSSSIWECCCSFFCCSFLLVVYAFKTSLARTSFSLVSARLAVANFFSSRI